MRQRDNIEALAAMLDIVNQSARLDRIEIMLAQVIGMLAKDEPVNAVPVPSGPVQLIDAEHRKMLEQAELGEQLARAIREVSR